MEKIFPALLAFPGLFVTAQPARAQGTTLNGSAKTPPGGALSVHAPPYQPYAPATP